MTDLVLLRQAIRRTGSPAALARALGVKANTPHMTLTRLRAGGRLSPHLRYRLEALVAPRLDLAPIAPLVQRVRLAVRAVERALADLEALDKKSQDAQARIRRA